MSEIVLDAFKLQKLITNCELVEHMEQISIMNINDWFDSKIVCFSEQPQFKFSYFYYFRI